MPSWLITGASRGIGYAWITHLAAQPSNTVIALVRNKKATEESLAKDNVKNVHVVSADVTDVAALEQAASEVAKVTGNGGIDYLIHNAALVSQQSGFLTVLDDSLSDFDEDLTSSFQANVLGTSHVIRMLLPLIRRGRAKKVIVTSSGMADLDLINKFDIAIAGPYAISKAAANVLVGKYHAALGKKEGILFFSMSPGLVDTREKPPTDVEMEGFKAMAAQFAEYAPHFKGPITPAESVAYQLKVIDKATVETYGGSFVSHFGNQQWL